MSVDINNNPKTKKTSVKNSNGATESTLDDKAEKVVQAKNPSEKVAIHSTRNVSWYGVGEVIKGYNIVTRSVADMWLERDHIRIATPEEVAKEYGL